MSIGDWFKEVEDYLEQCDDTTVFEGSLRDYDDNPMAGVSSGVFKKNTLDAYLHVLYDDTYSTSIIFPKKTLMKIFEDAKNCAPYFWSIYPHLSLLYFCAKYGDIVPMASLAVKMQARNSDIYFDFPRTKEMWHYPYATIDSRQKQMLDIAKLFKSLNLPNEFNALFLGHLLIRQCQWLNLAFNTPYAWALIPENFPKFHYWHKVFWESYVNLSGFIRNLYGISLLDLTIDEIFKQYDLFCRNIAGKEIQEVQSLFFAQKHSPK